MQLNCKRRASILTPAAKPKHTSLEGLNAKEQGLYRKGGSDLLCTMLETYAKIPNNNTS